MNVNHDSAVEYVFQDRNALTFGESFAILSQTRQLHLLPFKWSRLLLGKILGTRSLGPVPAPTTIKLQLSSPDACAAVYNDYPALADVVTEMTDCGFANPNVLKRVDPRNDFPTYTVISLDPGGRIGCSTNLMDVGSQVALWTDLLSVCSDGTQLVTSNHPESGKLRPRPGIVHRRFPGHPISTLQKEHVACISNWNGVVPFSIESLICTLVDNYEKQIAYFIDCGLYVRTGANVE
jgi:hypothetical protein